MLIEIANPVDENEHKTQASKQAIIQMRVKSNAWLESKNDEHIGIYLRIENGAEVDVEL